MPCLQPFAVPLLLENQTWKNIGPVITRFWKGRALKKKKKATTRSSNVGFLSFILNKSGTLLFTFIERKSIVRGNFWKDGTRFTRCWYLPERKERYLILKRSDFIKLYIVWKFINSNFRSNKWKGKGTIIYKISYV